MTPQPDLLQGTLDVLVLKALTWGPRHGHAVARMIRSASGGAFEVLDGSLYAALHRLEEREWVEAEWGLSDKGKRAKFYKLTTRGRQQLRAESASWQRYAAAVAAMLGATTLPAEA
ncbi:MAG TPA: PadR family transcriptional regulator [Gemmatimonadaceae bacterium]|nr:PadR family transcriptional regulator [Gemmatimonadaceae bacterium]